MTDSEKLDFLIANAQKTSEDLAIIKSDVAELKTDVAVLKLDVAELKTDVEVLKSDVAELKFEMSEVKLELAEVKEDVAFNQQRINQIQITLENVTNRNISIVAEGHQNLDRKLNDALKVDCEKEMLLIRVNILEHDVKDLKEKFQKIS